MKYVPGVLGRNGSSGNLGTLDAKCPLLEIDGDPLRISLTYIFGYEKGPGTPLLICWNLRLVLPKPFGSDVFLLLGGLNLDGIDGFIRPIIPLEPSAQAEDRETAERTINRCNKK